MHAWKMNRSTSVQIEGYQYYFIYISFNHNTSISVNTSASMFFINLSITYARLSIYKNVHSRQTSLSESTVITTIKLLLQFYTLRSWLLRSKKKDKYRSYMHSIYYAIILYYFVSNIFIILQSVCNDWLRLIRLRIIFSNRLKCLFYVYQYKLVCKLSFK